MPHLRQARNKHTASERVRVVRTNDRQTACHATLLTNRCSSLCFLLFPSCIVFRTCTRRNRSPYSRSLSLSIYLESNCLPISPNLIPKLSFRLLYRLTSWLTAGFTHSTIFFFSGHKFVTSLVHGESESPFAAVAFWHFHMWKMCIQCSIHWEEWAEIDYIGIMILLPFNSADPDPEDTPNQIICFVFAHRKNVRSEWTPPNLIHLHQPKMFVLMGINSEKKPL